MANKNIIKEYSSEEITIIWKPGKCIHAANCINTLPHVYRLDENPWIVLENATTDELIDQISTCPSGALSYKLVDNTKITNTKIIQWKIQK